jgi:hypothetical protein
MKGIHGHLRLRYRDKHMVVVGTCHNIAANADLPKRIGERGSEAHSRKIRMHGERNPRGSE